MDEPSLRGLIQRILLSVFVVALFAGSGGFYLLLRDRAMRQAEQEARILLGSAIAIRDYTNGHVVPLLTQLPAGSFHEESVPSYAAQTIFRSVTGMASAYTYREPALNPTSLNDSATPFDVDLIRRFRDDRALSEISGVYDTGTQKLFYLARPINIADAQCLACHSEPARAPAAMLAKYGRDHGFGWTLGETIGVQLLTVPMTQELSGTLELVGLLAGGLLLIFVICYFALTFSLETMVVRPLRLLTRAADAASHARGGDLPMPTTGVGEFHQLADAIERMRVSMTKALAALNHGKGEGDAAP